MKYIFFTRKRPMQFRAFLESFLFYCYPVKYEDIYVLVSDPENYEDIIERFPTIKWTEENKFGGFEKTLRHIFNQIDDNELVLPGCDDCVYFRNVNLNHAQIINNNPKILTFSLRLGKNIISYSESWNLSQKLSPYSIITWPGKPSHFGWVFELMGSIYRASLFKEILTVLDNIRIPNDLESGGVNYCNANYANKQPLMAFSRDFSALAAADINVTQKLYPNKIEGNENHTVEKFLEMYKEGYRINWYNYCGIVPNDCFIGLQNFSLVKI